MCGIVAISSSCQASDDHLAKEILSAIRHRGPDDEGIWSSSGATLAAARLAILDPGHARQPLTNETGDVAAVHNGEIYNFRNLRERLSSASPPRSDSDTDILPALYETYGEDFVDHLDGMFATVVTAVDEDLVLALRDPFGIKPLYYAEDAAGRTIFCSEIRPLQSIASPPGVVRTLAPGTLWSNGRIRRYYDLPRPSSPATCADELRRRLTASIIRHLPQGRCGIFLSGGLDSGILATVAREHVPLVAYSVGTEDSRDLPHARRVAEQLGIPHRVRILTADDMLARLPDVIRHLEGYDRYQVLCALPFWFAAEMAHEDGLKVVLCGEGSDEIFAGYDHFLEFGRHDLEKSVRSSLRRLHASELQRVDRMTMAWSVEARVPFLTRDVVEYGLAVPVDLKVPETGPGAGIEKWILRKAFEGFVDSETLWRRKDNVYRASGVEDAITPIVTERYPPERFQELQERYQPWPVRSPEELYYFEIWRESFPQVAAAYDLLDHEDPEAELIYSGFRVLPDP